jgi:hypothetical protein
MGQAEEELILRILDVIGNLQRLVGDLTAAIADCQKRTQLIESSLKDK